jgi:hypothetical protein
MTVLLVSSIHAADRPKVSDLFGERMVYDIKEFGIKIGEASLAFEGIVDHDGRKALLIHSYWKVFGVTNDERVYVDPQTLHTLNVTKDRVKFFCRININEEYAPAEGKVTIDRDSCGADSQKVIERNVPVDNIYAAIYRLRMRYALKDQRPFQVHLFDRDVNLKFRGSKMLKIFRRKYQTDHFDGERFAIWLDQSAERVPLRFDSDMEGHRVMMIMKERTKGNQVARLE